MKFKDTWLGERITRKIDSLTGRGALETGLVLGIAATGYRVFKHPSGALFGVTAYKLATAPAGTPPVSQIVGLAGLAALGLAGFVGAATEPPITQPWTEPAVQPAPPLRSDGTQRKLIPAMVDPLSGRTSCPMGYNKVSPWPGLIMCQES